jgi:cob(I)alamin adenosyltransferase
MNTKRSETPRKKTHGMLIVYTGDGKGKTTAALGMLTRAWGRGLRTCMIQFIKAETGNWGEVKAAQKMGIEWHKMGDGFTWTSRDMEETQVKARHGWNLAQEKISSGEYDLIVLDEFTYPLHFGWIDSGEVLIWLQANKPPNLHLVITGRDAPQALLDAADLVTEMQEVKHPFNDGYVAQAGVDY